MTGWLRYFRYSSCTGSGTGSDSISTMSMCSSRMASSTARLASLKFFGSYKEEMSVIK
jgi:hypothetical protein